MCTECGSCAYLLASSDAKHIRNGDILMATRGIKSTLRNSLRYLVIKHSKLHRLMKNVTYIIYWQIFRGGFSLAIIATNSINYITFCFIFHGDLRIVSSNGNINDVILSSA